MRATRLPLRVVPGEYCKTAQGKVSERLREALRGFTLHLRALRCWPRYLKHGLVCSMPDTSVLLSLLFFLRTALASLYHESMGTSGRN